MLRPCRLALLIAAIALNAHALPTSSYSTSEVVRRQFNGPQSIQTVNSFSTPAGLVTERCQVTFTPIRGAVVGQDLVRENKKCTVTVDNSRAISSAIARPPASTAVVRPPPPAVSSSLVRPPPPAARPTTLSIPPPAAISSVASPPPATVIPPTSSAVGGSQVIPPASAPVVVNPVSSVAAPPAAVTPPTPAGASTPSASALAATTASPAAEQASTAPAFEIPGKKLEVLPIGLGVFAGISVIALIVVGLVTYERTKYRRAFRQRKLAETAQPMGYGGMAERA